MSVIVQTYTTDIPVTMMGEMAGRCWGADTSDHLKNFNRGVECIQNNHGRVMEYPKIYLEISGYSARVMREFNRHIGGLPTFLQASTRYIDYNNFKYIIPKSIKDIPEAETIYKDTCNTIRKAVSDLNSLGIKKEDSAMLLPLGMETTIVWCGNLRTLFDMAKVRLCKRAYWEFRQLFKDTMESLSIYSDEWKYLIEDLKIFKPKCEDYGYCNEKKSCGRKPIKEDKNV